MLPKKRIKGSPAVTFTNVISENARPANEQSFPTPFFHFPNTPKVPPMSRREQIESMLTENPTDTFLRYALAMELDSEQEHDQSLEIFDGLTKNTPPYVPAFFMAGQQLARIDRIDDARAILRDGIEQAREQNDLHAASEMSEFLGQLGQLGE